MLGNTVDIKSGPSFMQARKQEFGRQDSLEFEISEGTELPLEADVCEFESGT